MHSGNFIKASWNFSQETCENARLTLVTYWWLGEKTWWKIRVLAWLKHHFDWNYHWYFRNCSQIGFYTVYKVYSPQMSTEPMARSCKCWTMLFSAMAQISSEMMQGGGSVVKSSLYTHSDTIFYRDLYSTILYLTLSDSTSICSWFIWFGSLVCCYISLLDLGDIWKSKASAWDERRKILKHPELNRPQFEFRERMAAKDLGGDEKWWHVMTCEQKESEKTCWSTISHAMSIFNTVIMKGRLQKPAPSAFDAGPSLKWSFWTHIWYSSDFSCARATVGMCAIIIPCRHDWPTCQHEAGWWVLPSDSRAEAVFFVAGSREIGMSYAHRPCHGPQRLF